MIGVTGASGRLGSILMQRLPDALPIARRVPSDRMSLIIHTATPRDINNPVTIDGFNLALRQYCNLYKPRMIVVGSCWQILEGETHDTPYAQMKRRQTALFPEATHVIPYWIYGPGKGFIYKVAQALAGIGELSTAGIADRDFISVHDVATDIISSTDLETEKCYASCTEAPISPVALARNLGLNPQPVEPHPQTILSYPLARIAKHETDITEWVRSTNLD